MVKRANLKNTSHQSRVKATETNKCLNLLSSQFATVRSGLPVNHLLSNRLLLFRARNAVVEKSGILYYIP